MNMQQISQNQIQNLLQCRKTSSSSSSLAASKTAAQPLQNDAVELSGKKEVKNKKKIIGFLIGAASAAVLAFFLIRKNRLSEVKELTEKIDFKKAKTVEEAMQFGKDNLGIKQYQGFEEADTDVINWVNEGFVNTANALKGKLRVPKKVLYDNFDDKRTLAGVTPDNKYFIINKEIFSNLDESINKRIEVISGPKIKNPFLIRKKDRSLQIGAKVLDTSNARDLIKDIEKFERGEITTFAEKIKLYNNVYSFSEILDRTLEAPLVRIREILNSPYGKAKIKNAPELLAKAEKSSFKKQQSILKSLLNHKDLDIRIGSTYSSEFRTIYHEMGHIQDMKPRVQTTQKFKSPDKYPKELAQWVNDEKNMQIARSVSNYSCSGPGEFIAEVFAGILEGRKISPEALELYKKLEGPSIPGLI